MNVSTISILISSFSLFISIAVFALLRSYERKLSKPLSEDEIFEKKSTRKLKTSKRKPIYQSEEILWAKENEESSSRERLL